MVADSINIELIAYSSVLISSLLLKCCVILTSQKPPLGICARNVKYALFTILHFMNWIYFFLNLNIQFYKLCMGFYLLDNFWSDFMLSSLILSIHVLKYSFTSLSRLLSISWKWLNVGSSLLIQNLLKESAKVHHWSLKNHLLHALSSFKSIGGSSNLPNLIFLMYLHKMFLFLKYRLASLSITSIALFLLLFIM